MPIPGAFSSLTGGCGHDDAVEEYQRRIWKQMIDTVDGYRSGRLPLSTLVADLPGFVEAAELHDRTLLNGFWGVFSEIDAEFELRTEPWAPPGLASDDRLAAAIDRFRDWALGVLDRASDQRQ